MDYLLWREGLVQDLVTYKFLDLNLLILAET